jgi:hypothetical protein
LVSCCWLHDWYVDSAPTPKTIFIAYEDPIFDQKFTQPKFVRLDSMSPKCVGSKGFVSSVLEATTLIDKSQRCQNGIAMARRIGATPTLCIRDVVDVDKGYEFRCYIYNYKLVAIGTNDDKILPSTITEQHVKTACEALLTKINHHIPSPDCTMDVIINFETNDNWIFEFNSYGFWGNADGGRFDWIEDAAILYNIGDSVTTPEIRLNFLI